MKKVLLRAPLLTNSGYGVHSRQVFEWLLEKNIDLHVECLKWGNTPWMLNEEEEPLVKEIMLRSKKLEPPYDVTFQLQLPDEWDPSLGKYNVGMSAFVETQECSPKWIDACNKMDQIITPSTFTKNVVKRSGVLSKKISVVPEWFNDKIDKNTKPLNLNEIKTKKNYLLISVLTAIDPKSDRKNLIKTLQWLFEYHKDDEDVGIVLKTCLGRGSKKDLLETDKYLKSLVEETRKSLYPKLYLVHGNMSDKEIAELYKSEKIKCLVSATRGEGYGLPLVEAAASGMPIIATNWSGHLEFLQQGKFIPIDYELKEIPENKVDDRIFYKGFKWAEPKKESFWHCLDDFNKNEESWKEKAIDMSKDIHANFSKRSIKKVYDKLMQGII